MELLRKAQWTDEWFKPKGKFMLMQQMQNEMSKLKKT